MPRGVCAYNFGLPLAQNYQAMLACVFKLYNSEVSGSSTGVVCPQFNEKLIFFNEICAIILSTKGFGLKNRNFGGFSAGQEVPKTIF
jgi:hypothetical protein